MAKRIQRKRTRGWKMPANAVYVGRPGKWGNPYKIGTIMIPDARAAVEAFAANLPLGKIRGIEELRGKDLACWCALVDEDGAPVPCHADILLKLANE
jgi:hypothetical protein